MGRKILSLMLAALMLVTAVPTVCADDGVVNGTVRYCSGHGSENDHDYETYFSYSDEYFAKSGYAYRQDLAEASLALALAAFSSKDAETLDDEDRNFVSMMQQCGFENISSNEWFGKKPEMNSIGVCAASKSIVDNGTDYTLIALGIRGNFYRREWGGNTVVGAAGDHEGFTLASAQALDYLKQYIADNSIAGPVKLWITGYSRSASVANLVAAQLDRGYELGSAKLMRHDLYCYCFEPPMGTTAGDTDALIFRNIHNVINENDLITYVLFDKWGFSRYGTDHSYPTRGDADYEQLKAAMVEEFNTIPNNGGEYSIDDFKYIGISSSAPGSKMTQKQYFKLLTGAMTTDFVSSREDYVENVQDSLSEVVAVWFDRKQFDFELVLRIFAGKLKDNFLDILAGYNGGDIQSSDAYKTVEELFFESLNEAGITEFNAEQARNALRVLLTRLTTLMVKHPDVALTLLANISPIMSAHYVETCLAWMHTLPDDYMTAKSEAPRLDGIFSDVDGDAWYAQAAVYNLLGGTMVGVGNNCFAPDADVSRAMLAAVLYRMAGQPAVRENAPFNDVSDGTWYSDSVAWAYENGVVSGYPDGSFKPHDPVSREDGAAMLYRYAGSPAASAGLDAFPDASAVSPYARPALSWTSSLGITVGYDDGCLHPQSCVTRAQMASIIQRYCEN